MRKGLIKTLSVVLVVCMLMACITAVAFAVADGTYYSIDTDGDVKIGQSTKVMLLTETVAGGVATVTETNGVTFTSSDSSVVEISGGTLIGKKAGIAVITATGFNPNFLRDKRSMTVVVSNGAESTANYNNETAGTYQETLGGYTVPYSYTEYPRHGLAGKSLSYDALKAADYASYGMAADAQPMLYNDISVIEAGKVGELWIRHESTAIPSTKRYFDFVFPDGARMKIQAYGTSGTVCMSVVHGSPAGTFIVSNIGEGYGDGLFIFNPNTWYQFVIDGSQVDPETGVGTFHVYINGAKLFSYSNTQKITFGRVSVYRSMNVSNGTGADSKNYYVDDIKLYTLPELVSNTVNVGEGGKVTIDGTVYTGSSNTINTYYAGESMSFTVTPDSGKLVDTISYNDTQLVNTMTSVTVAEGATLTVTFKDDPAFKTPSVNLYTAAPVNTLPNEKQPFSTHTVYGTIAGWRNVDGYGMELSDGAESVLLPCLTSEEAFIWLDEAEGKFALRVFGEGIVGKTFTLTPYITVDGNNSFGESSDEFTGSKAE